MTDVRTERCRDAEMQGCSYGKKMGWRYEEMQGWREAKKDREMKECRDAGCRYRAMKRWREDRVAMDREKMKRCRDREMYGSIDA